jgi:hypothetical protein
VSGYDTDAPIPETRVAPAKKTSKKKPGKKRKNLILDQSKIDRAKDIFGVATETEAIHRALDAADDLARFRGEVERGLPDLLGKGGFTDHFAPARPNASKRPE